MVIEDDVDVRDALVEVLSDNGYTTIQASNGQEAIELLRSALPMPTLILLDVMMPVMDGWEFRNAQRADASIAEIPVVVLTAHANAQRTAEQMAAAGFLKKPVTLEALLETIDKFCG